jgi:formamidopyrimidine-DNA glycosylase
MPELPEVETVRRTLSPHLVGRRIESVSVGRERVVRRTSASALIDGLSGASVTAVRRRGKYLLCDLDTGRVLMVHLRMTGQLLVADASEPRAAHTHVVMGLDDGSEIRFIDPRTFGEMVVYDPDRSEIETPDIAALGVDPITDDFSVADVRRILRGHHRQLKALLLDQHQIAGLGNIYADEVLHRARLHPLRRSNTVGAPAELRLHRAIVDVLTAAIEAGGSTLGDATYIDADGMAGSFQVHHLVYGRTGLRCETCRRGRIARTTVAQRSTHYCPWCQRIGRRSVETRQRVPDSTAASPPSPPTSH